MNERGRLQSRLIVIPDHVRQPEFHSSFGKLNYPHDVRCKRCRYIYEDCAANERCGCGRDWSVCPSCGFTNRGPELSQPHGERGEGS